MVNRKRAMAAVGACVLGLALTVPMQGSEVNLRTSRLTFSGPVRLPGVTLIAGTYVFERAEASNPNVIAVRSGDRARVYYMGNTLPVERPAGLARGRLVVLGEAPRGTLPPIEAWYPEGDSYGHAFIYRNR